MGKSPSHDLTVASPLLSFPASVVEVAGHAHVLLAAFEKVSAILATTLWPECGGPSLVQG